MTEKKIPLRRCAGCSAKKEKRDLIRIVKTPEGQVLLDENGRTNGRGVYLCRDRACLTKAQKTRRPEKSLGCAIPDAVWKALLEKTEHE